MDDDLDPLVPRPLDRPMAVPLEPGVDLSPLDTGKILAAPDDPALWPQWRETLARWRSDARERHGYDDAIYQRPELRWASGASSSPRSGCGTSCSTTGPTHRFTPERLLADARDRFGGFDGVVLWHAYPVIGIDDRNQWDFYRDIAGLPELVKALHDAGVRVFVDYNPWDIGTRRSGDDAAELAALVAELERDGVFLDTLKEGDGSLSRSLDAARPGIALEGESKLAAGPDRRPQPLLGPVVRRLARARGAARPTIRAPAPAAPRPALAPRPRRGAAVGLAQRRRGDGVGGRLRRVGRLDRPGRRGAAPDDAGPARPGHSCVEGEWTPLADLGEDAAAAGVFGSTFTAATERLVTLVNRRHDAVVRLDRPG